ncbi:MAG: hypothetical protein IJQ12_01995 [Lachnospiraceae bacterium]|nr:hypothetical protein [Lachnospiraceae bacterium]
MGMSIGNNYSNMFSSLNGQYNAAADMSSVISQRSQIQNGSYGKLMKAYVGKVGNKAALNAYRSNGTTVQSATEVSGTTAQTSGAGAAATTTAGKYARYKSNFLDSHLSSIGQTRVSSTTAAGKGFLNQHLKEAAGTEKTGVQRAIEAAEKATGMSNPFPAATQETQAQDPAAQEQYANMQTSWLDNHLKSYDQNAAVSTAANSSVAIDTAV